MLVTGVFIGVFLIADALGLVANHTVFNDVVLHGIYRIVSALAAIAALVIAALCLKRGLDQPRQGQRNNRNLYLFLALALVLCAGAVTVRQGVLVRATGRAPEDHFPFGVIVVGFISGLVLFLTGKGRIRQVGLFFLFAAPVFMILAFITGLRIDFLAITEARATHLGRAIENYRLEQGKYPAGLSALTPDYVPLLLGPLTGRGQVWCYQAGADGFRVGYAYLQRYYDWGDGITPFYEPYFAIITPIAVGQPPQGSWMCDKELQQLRIHFGL